MAGCLALPVWRVVRVWARRALAFRLHGQARCREDMRVAWARTGRRLRGRVKECEWPGAGVRCVQRTRGWSRVRTNSGYGGRWPGQSGAKPLLDGLHRRARCAHGIGGLSSPWTAMVVERNKEGKNQSQLVGRIRVK